MWQKRICETQLLAADGKLILLDEDGTLALAEAALRVSVLAQASVLENLSWTPPTLAGTKLYPRDVATWWLLSSALSSRDSEFSSNGVRGDV
jgi:hypothetical protein